jgi:hypothetical protein
MLKLPPPVGSCTRLHLLAYARGSSFACLRPWIHSPELQAAPVHGSTGLCFSGPRPLHAAPRAIARILI